MLRIERIWYYKWLHIPSGKQGVSSISLFSIQELNEKLADWNSMSPGTWQYWSVNPYSPTAV